MSTILEADDTGALRLPPELLPHPAPGRRYRVASGAGQVIVDEIAGEGDGVRKQTPRFDAAVHREWMRSVWGDRLFSVDESREAQDRRFAE